MRHTFALTLALLLAASAEAQTLPITFRFLDPGVAEAAFVPGSFNGWGQPYTGGTASCIMTGDESQMSFVRFQNYWTYTTDLGVGQTYTYKIQYHTNIAGTECVWLSDPWNPVVTGNNDDSVIEVRDPMVFQPAEEPTGDGLIDHVSAGLFSSTGFTAITFSVNGVEQTNGLDFYDPATGIFRYELDREVRSGARFQISATDASGTTVSGETGRLLPPLEWRDDAFTTVEAETDLVATITRLDGSIDPNLTEATLLKDGSVLGTVTVNNGQVNTMVALDLGLNSFELRADIDGQTLTSDPLLVTRRPHPLDDVCGDVEVSGSDFSFNARLTNTAIPPPMAGWIHDEHLSTAPLTEPLGFQLDGRAVFGTAAGPGEIYIDVEVPCPDGDTDQFRVAIVIENDGNVRELGYAETASWIDNAVVYEIFPLTFGPEARGSFSSPGRKFQEITEHLDFVAEMGFNTIWFMPIYVSQNLTGLSGGYNTIDLYNVDPNLGTNDDFKALVQRAHELGIRVILDFTPNHVAPRHPWINSLREGGRFSRYVQTTPSAHNRGLDGRGANLPEIWQTEGGRDLYRKYDGFGDLANLDWDNDDLQAEMLDVMAHWVREFDIDGWRLDVYWGPWRKFGPERFGTPLRQHMRRLKPDQWLLGEINGTGSGTDVYYADTDLGADGQGGLDAAYDWGFYFSGIRGTYGDVRNYNTIARNNDFWPGPNARYFRFLENHDEPRIIKQFAGNPERILPLTTFLMTTTGIPMVYQGQEVGYGGGSGDTRRLPVDWTTDRNDVFARHYQVLAHARAQLPAFGTQQVETLGLNADKQVYAYVRPMLDQNAVVVINFSDQQQDVFFNPDGLLELSTDGPVPYYNVLADTSGSALGGFSATLAPYGSAVYIAGDASGFAVPGLPDLPFGALYTAIESVADLPEAFRLDANYPNPFNPTTTIRYHLPTGGPVRLAVYDVLGREVAVLADGLRSAGSHTATFDARTLASGLYLYRLESGTQVQQRTMMLVK